MSYAGLEEFYRSLAPGSEMASMAHPWRTPSSPYVHGDAVQGYLVNYQQKVTTLSELKGTDQALSPGKGPHQPASGRGGGKEPADPQRQEVQRLTNNHVANLEVMIRTCAMRIDELGKLATLSQRA